MEWDFFLSHATEDAESVAEPMAHVLSALGYKVWYDDFELRVGDSLLQKINRGLANSRFGILVLSPYFLAKGWTNAELAALFARDLSEQRVILPIWHRVGKPEVLRHYPLLADRLAVSTELGLKEVCKQIVRSAFPEEERKSGWLQPPLGREEVRNRFRRLLDRGASVEDIRLFVSAHDLEIFGGLASHRIVPRDIGAERLCDFVTVEGESSDFSQFAAHIYVLDDAAIAEEALLARAAVRLAEVERQSTKINSLLAADRARARPARLPPKSVRITSTWIHLYGTPRTCHRLAARRSATGSRLRTSIGEIVRRAAQC